MKGKNLSKHKSSKNHAKKAGVGIIAACILVFIFILFLRNYGLKSSAVTTFDQCVEKNGVVMESYPRQCRVDNKTFVEEIKNATPEIIQIKKGTSDLALDLPRGNYVINSESDWKEVFGDMEIDPTIDFNTQTVIAIVMGQKNTGGYSVALSQVNVEEDKISYMVNETVPGKNCIVTQAFTNPYQIIAIEKTEKEIMFLANTILTECGE